MKKYLNYSLLFFSLFFMGYYSVYAYDVYTVDDYVYFDPVSNSTCNDSNYWTIYHPDTTCFRFIVLDPSDTSSKSSLRVMLDHNLGVDTFDNYQSVLNSNTSNWSRYTGNIVLPDEGTIANIMKLGSERPEVVDGVSTSINGGVKVYTLMTNTLYMTDKANYNSAGYWLSGSYTNSNYAYTVTEYANNRLVLKTENRGIRPMLEIDKSLLTKSSVTVDISSSLESATEYKYPYPTEQYDGHTYKQLQGFTVTNSKLVFYSSNNGNPEKGLVISYGGNNFQTLHKIDYGTTGHGNGMTFNTKTNRVLVTGPNGYKDIYEYDADTLNRTNIYNESTGYTGDYGGIGYDSFHDYYVGQTGRRIYIMNNQFKALCSFDSVHLLTSQDLEYHNGYVYYTTYEAGGESSYQMYYFNEPSSAKVYVYNAMFKADGTPEEDFGRLVKVLYISNINRDSLGGTGELESISFRDDKVWFAFAAKHFDSTNTYKFYSFDSSKVEVNPLASVKYTEGDKNTKVVVSSNVELKNVNGWTLADNKRSISKTYSDEAEASSLNVCDNYGNCTKKTINNLTLKKQTVSFSKDSVSKELKESSYTLAASTNGDGTLTYSSSNESIASVNSSGKVTFHQLGTVTITAVASKTSNYYEGSDTYSLSITKSNQIIEFDSTIVNKTYGDPSYTLAANHTLGDGVVTYTSSNEEVATVDNTGKVTIHNAGSTNIVATASGTEEFREASSSYALNVVAKAQKLSFPESTVIKKLSDKEYTIGVKEEDAKGDITYTSSDEKVAVVDNNGKVTLKSVGTTIITATAAALKNYDSTSTSYALNVTKGDQVIRLKDSSSSSLDVNFGTNPFKLNILHEVGDGELHYSSSDENIAKVSSDGVVTIVGHGIVTINVDADETESYGAVRYKITLHVSMEEETVEIPNTASFDFWKWGRIVLSLFLIFLGVVYIYRKKFFFVK